MTWELHEKEARSLLQEEGRSCTLVLTDPPYNVGMEYEDVESDELEPEEYESWMRDVFSCACRAAGESGCVAMVTPQTQMRRWIEIVDSLPMEEVKGSPVSWCRPNFAGHSSFGNGWDFAVYYIWMLHGEEWEVVTNPPASADVTSHNYIVEPVPQSDFAEGRHHPCQQPVRVYEKILLKATRPGDTVVDPFCGSGSVGVAAKKWQRDFIGGDISGEYMEVAERRIREAEVQSLERESRLDEF